jgi:hypothetical protein
MHAKPTSRDGKVGGATQSGLSLALTGKGGAQFRVPASVGRLGRGTRGRSINSSSDQKDALPSVSVDLARRVDK